MNEAWERAVEAALGDQAVASSSSPATPRSLTLDGAVKCPHGRLPSPEILERYQTLERLSIANVGVSSLEKFPRLRNLQRLNLSDNRIAGGLQFLVEAGLESLRDLDLSNNRIQFVEDLAPLAQLRLVSLDLYECPVTRIEDYRVRVFGMIRTLKYLDKLDVDENERAETDDEEDDDEEDDEEEDDEEDDEEEDPDGGDRVGKLGNGVGGEVGVFDEDEESDGEEESDACGKVEIDECHRSNGFRVVAAAGARVGVDDVGGDDEEEEDDVEDDGDYEDEEEDIGEEEIDEDDSDEEDVIEVHGVGNGDANVEEVEVEGDDTDEEDEEDGDSDGEEDVEDEYKDEEPRSTGWSTDGEIDGHDRGEGDGEDDDNGEIGVDDEDGQEIEVSGDFEDDGEEEEEDGAEFLVQPIGRPANENVGSDVDADSDEDENEDEVDDLDVNVDEDEDEDGVDDVAQDENINGVQKQPSASHSNKRKREDGNLDDDVVEDLRSSKHN